MQSMSGVDTRPVSPVASRARLAVHEEAAWRFTTLDKCVTALAVAAFVTARLLHVPNFKVWFDEIFTIETAWRDWGSMMTFIQNYDVHPPLFYVLAKLWMNVGGMSFIWMGLFPALTAVATIYPTYLLARELRMRPAEFNVLVILMALNGYLTGYAQEFRAYDWLMLLSIFAIWLFVKFCNVPEDAPVAATLLPLSIVNLLIAYTHYYGWLLIGAQGLFLLFWQWRRAVAFAAAGAAIVLAYLPWAYLVIRAAGERVDAGQKAVFFIPKPDLYSVVFYYGALTGLFDIPNTTLAGVLLFSIPVGFWMLRSLQRNQETSGSRGTLVLFLLMAIVPVLAAFVISLILPTAIWGQRHLIISALPFYLLVAVGLWRVPTRVLRAGAIAAVCGWALLAGFAAQRAPYKVPAWDALVERVMAQTPPGQQKTRVYAADEDAAMPMQFYFWRAGRHDIEVVILQADTPFNRDVFVNGTVKPPYWALTVPVILVKDLSELGNTPFWMCDDQDDAANLGFPGKTLREAFADRGYAVGDTWSTTLVNRRWNSRTVGVFPVGSNLAAADSPSTRSN